MSSSDDSTLAPILRTVTPPYGSRENLEMDTIGWSAFLIMVIVFLPLLPFVLLIWLISKAVGALGGRS